MKAVNNNLLCAAAQLLIDSKDQDDFGVAEEMLYQMLRRRQTVRNTDILNKVRAIK